MCDMVTPTKESQMSEHFIKNIEIKNFKCFEDFKAEGFGRVNLIGGKNNVGKTAFMESVYVNINSQTVGTLLYALVAIKSSRYTLDILDDKNRNINFSVKRFIEDSNNIYTKSNINEVSFNIKDTDGVKGYFFKLKERDVRVNINNFSFELEDSKNINYIDNLGLNKSSLKEAFIAVQIRDKEDTLYKYINSFDSDVINFKIIGGDIPQCKSSNGEYRDLNQFGDGLKHFISVICSIYASSNGYLFIDEVENGIHYTKMELFWSAVLRISKAQNVQVFATTHSAEAIESFTKVSKKLEDEDITYIKITKLEENKRIAGIRDFEMLEYILEDGHEARE